MAVQWLRLCLPMQGVWVWFLVGELREKAVAPHSSTLAWKIPWAEEPGRLQSMGSHRVGHDWRDLAVIAIVRLCSVSFRLLLLSRFSCVLFCATLWAAAHQAPLSTGFSRQDYWSGLPFPSPAFLLTPCKEGQTVERGCGSYYFELLVTLHPLLICKLLW